MITVLTVIGVVCLQILGINLLCWGFAHLITKEPTMTLDDLNIDSTFDPRDKDINPELKPVVEAAIEVVRAAMIGDQNFIYCLQRESEQVRKLRLAIVSLSDALKEMP